MSQPIRIGQRSLGSHSTFDSSLMFSSFSHSKTNRLSNVWMSQGLITSSSGSIYFVGDNEVDTTNMIPSTLFSLNAEGQLNSVSISLPTSEIQWSALVATQSTPPFIIVGQSEPIANQYAYTAYWLWENGTLSEPIAATQPQTVYVNTFFADYSACSQSLYLLVGHEDTAFSMFVKLFTFNIESGVVSEVNVQNNQYTIQEVHASSDCSSPYVYSLSPGLFGEPTSEEKPHAWSLITIDPTSGTVVSGVQIFPTGLFRNYYGGIAYGPLTPENQILHLFTREVDNAKVIAAVNTQTAQVDTFSYIDLGDVESVFDFNSLVFIS